MTVRILEDQVSYRFMTDCGAKTKAKGKTIKIRP